MQELNTAEDFISFYEEFFPLVQTLPQIILQKDLIVSSLLSRLKMAGRLSLEPILRYLFILAVRGDEQNCCFFLDEMNMVNEAHLFL